MSLRPAATARNVKTGTHGLKEELLHLNSHARGCTTSARSRNGETNAINADDPFGAFSDAPGVEEAHASVVEVEEGVGGRCCNFAETSSRALYYAYVRRINTADHLMKKSLRT